MDHNFRASGTAIASLVALGAAAGTLGFFYPTLSILLGCIGVLATGFIWFKVALRTRRWFWWEFASVPVTQTEGLVGLSGVVLFAVMFVALLASMGHAV
jgi:hypothetical protein